MTQRQIKLARHALGLGPGRTITTRNYFLASRGTADFANWRKMELTGLAQIIRSQDVPPGWLMFRLTRAGAERALLPGDVLDSEDWP